jgi:hypothetical protein
MRHRRDVVVMIERRIERRRCLLEMGDDLLLFLAIKTPLGARKVGGKGGEHRQLASERLG